MKEQHLIKLVTGRDSWNAHVTGNSGSITMLVWFSSMSLAGLLPYEGNLIKSGREMTHKLGLSLHVGTHGVSMDYAWGMHGRCMASGGGLAR